MTIQPSLFAPTPAAKFTRWVETHKDIYRLCVHFAREAHATGRRIGMKAIWERVRWECSVKRQNGDAYALNNCHVSRLARLIMEREPDLANLFETRELRS